MYPVKDPLYYYLDYCSTLTTLFLLIYCTAHMKVMHRKRRYGVAWWMCLRCESVLYPPPLNPHLHDENARSFVVKDILGPSRCMRENPAIHPRWPV